MLNCVVLENKERDKREKNIVIFGIQASSKTEPNEIQTEDTDTITALLERVNISKDKIVRCFRLKSKDTSKPQPIIVEMINNKSRNEAVRLSRRQFENIYVNPDLTESQRNLDKQLREECRKKNEPLKLKDTWATAAHYFAIRNNVVVKIVK